MTSPAPERARSPRRLPRSLQVHEFGRSRFGPAGRNIRVWLPRDYLEHGEQRYAVLYLQDGQNLFEPETAFGGVAWQAGATAQRLLDQRKIRPLILVGIDNAGAHRTDDYTQVQWRGRGGHAREFARMLIGEIKPFVDRHYRTLPGPEATAIGGASLGGLFALWLALSRPDVFGHVAALSPTAWWGNGLLTRLVRELAARPAVRIWLDAGMRDEPALRQAVQKLADELRAKGYTKHRTAARATLRHGEFARARHDEASWGRRFDRVLKFLVPPLPRSRRQATAAAAGSPARPSRT